MTRNQLESAIRKWHKDNGGDFIIPSAHALRLLHEVVELCIAEGATPHEIMYTAEVEIKKAWAKKELPMPDRFDIGLRQENKDKRAEEWADCYMLMEILRGYEGFEVDGCVKDKYKILLTREWEADAAGVLWRPSND